MRAVVTRVQSAEVRVGAEIVGAIGRGLLGLIGVAAGDGEVEARYVAGKIARLRVFPPDVGADRYECSVRDAGGSCLLVSQFTLYGDVRHGNRPGFSAAMASQEAEMLFRLVVETVRAQGIVVATGRFGATMHVASVNDGPTTILIDSTRQF